MCVAQIADVIPDQRHTQMGAQQLSCLCQADCRVNIDRRKLLQHILHLHSKRNAVAQKLCAHPMQHSGTLGSAALPSGGAWHTSFLQRTMQERHAQKA